MGTNKREGLGWFELGMLAIGFAVFVFAFNAGMNELAKIGETTPTAVADDCGCEN